jgi:hypothetical protein
VLTCGKGVGSGSAKRVDVIKSQTSAARII